MSFLATVGFVSIAFVIVYACERWILRWFARWQAERFIRRHQAGKLAAAAKQSVFVNTHDALGFAVSRGGSASDVVASIPWARVRQVTAFKRDWGTVDCICVAVFTDDDSVIEVNEEMAGWESLTEALPNHLSGSRQWAECFSQVAFPAFATNETPIFSRPDAG